MDLVTDRVGCEPHSVSSAVRPNHIIRIDVQSLPCTSYDGLWAVAFGGQCTAGEGSCTDHPLVKPTAARFDFAKEYFDAAEKFFFYLIN